MTHVLIERVQKFYNKYFVIRIFFSGSRAFYEVMWKNMVQSDRPHVTL